MKNLLLIILSVMILSACGSSYYYTADEPRYQSKFSKDNITIGTTLVNFLEKYKSSPIKNIRQEGDTIITELKYLEKGDDDTYIYSTFIFENGILTEMSQNIEVMKTPSIQYSEQKK